VKGIPRFVPTENYADNFGLQWNTFRRTQLDSFSGTTITRDRFFAQTEWKPERMRGSLVLDVGCGAGRFAEIAISTGARVIAVDYSGAVDACALNHAGATNLDVIQADIYAMPFKRAVFDFVYCFGVLQHTPAVRKAFDALPPLVVPGGYLAVDVYPKFWGNVFQGKYLLRPVTKRISKQTLFRMVRRAVPVLLPISTALGRVPRIGRRLRQLLPVANYDGQLPLTKEQLREWAVLDTYDMLAPLYDSPQSGRPLHEWFTSAGLAEVRTFRLGIWVSRGRRPG